MNRKKEELERFVRRFYDSELLISPMAREAMLKLRGKSVADSLQGAIIQYFSQPLNDKDEKLSEAGQELFDVMTIAYAYGCVMPSQDLLGKLEAERKKNNELLRDLSICLANYSALQKKHDQITRNLNQPPRKPSGNKEDAEDNAQ